MFYTDKTAFTEEETKDIIESYQNRTAINKLAEQYGSSYFWIKKLLIENNVFRVSPSSPRHYDVNTNYFDVIDDEHKAYWLGLMFADGYIARINTRENVQLKVGITLNVQDRWLLEEFKKDIEFTGEIRVYQSKSQTCFKDSEYARLLFSCQHMAEQLIAKGCVEHKSLVLKFPEAGIIPEHLMKHFLRGYFDGDGSLSMQSIPKEIRAKYSFTMEGTEDFLTGVKTVLGKENVKLIYYKKTDFCSLHLCGNRQILRIMNWLYEDATIYLPRKHEKYMGLVRHMAS